MVLSVMLNPLDSLAMEGMRMESSVPSSSGEGESIMADTSGKTRVKVSLEGLQYWEGNSESIPLDGLSSIPGEALLVMDVLDNAAVEVSPTVARTLLLVKSSFFGSSTVMEVVGVAKHSLCSSRGYN